MEKKSEKGLEYLKASYCLASAQELLRDSGGMIFSLSFASGKYHKLKVDNSHKTEKEVVWKRVMESEGCVISI